MLRDTRRSAEYFDELLPEFDEGIEETQQALDAMLRRERGIRRRRPAGCR